MWRSEGWCVDNGESVKKNEEEDSEREREREKKGSIESDKKETTRGSLFAAQTDTHTSSKLNNSFFYYLFSVFLFFLKN